MIKLLSTATFFFLMYILPFSLMAQNEQDSTKITTVLTNDGNEYNGLVIMEDDQKIVLETKELGDITILKTNIKKRSELSIDHIVRGEVWPENTQSSRYFWAPNAHGLKKGEGYYQNLWVFFNQVSLGITNNFSIGFGMVPLFLFGGDAASYSPLWVTPKFSIPVKKDKFSLGVGMLAGTAGFHDDAGFGILYGVGTAGDQNTNASFGLGYGYAGGNWANSPMINISVMHRTGKRGYILSENYVLPTGDGTLVLLSFGGRTVTRSIGIDYGLFFPMAGGLEFFGVPWLGITVPFNGKKK